MSAKVLGQSAPAATTNTDLYTVPSGKAAVSSSVVVCNRSAAAVSYRIAVRPAGAAIGNAHYLVYGVEAPPNSSDFYTIGITLAATDVVTVYAAAADLTFTLFGDESTA